MPVMMITGLKIEDVFKIVRNAVQDKTGNKQIPWESSSLTGDFYFIKPPAKSMTDANSYAQKALNWVNKGNGQRLSRNSEEQLG